jgi:hypothetical protein
MKKVLLLSAYLVSFLPSYAQQDTTSHAKVLIVPYQSMMYFSDADPDIARFSKQDEMHVRNTMRSNVESNVYHQLLSSFEAISLMRAASLNGEQDLNRIYGATRYTLYSREMKQAYMDEKGVKETSAVQNLLNKFSRKSKDQTFWVNDSTTMLAMIGDPELFKYLNKKYNENYILYLTQFEINTNNKNTIEWLKQDYKREFTLHYNLFDKSGNLLRAETLTVKGSNENTMKEINDKFIIVLAQHLKDILTASNK